MTSKKPDDEPEQPEGRFARWRLLIGRAVVVASVVLCGVGTLLWATVQDSVPILSGGYSALPLPVLITMGAIVSVVFLLTL